MRTLELILAILFLFSGIVGGLSERNYGMMFAGVLFGSALLFLRHRSLKNASANELKRQLKKKKKEEEWRHKYYLTDEGKKALMECIEPDELETLSWNTIAKSYASEDGQKLLHDRMREQVQSEEEPEE